jgi:hypothetical protein
MRDPVSVFGGVVVSPLFSRRLACTSRARK